MNLGHSIIHDDLQGFALILIVSGLYLMQIMTRPWQGHIQEVECSLPEVRAGM